MKSNLKRYYRLKKEGICVSCGKLSQEHGIYCNWCFEQMRSRLPVIRKKHREKMFKLKLCVYCTSGELGIKPGTMGKEYYTACMECRVKRAANSANWRKKRATTNSNKNVQRKVLREQGRRNIFRTTL